MILLTGGSGLLGRELRKHLKCYAPSSAEFDILRPPDVPHGVSMIVHAAAYTDVARAEVEREEAYGLNVIGTLNMALSGLPLVYISTEYVFDGLRGGYDEYDEPSPVNVYARTKYLGERMARRAVRWLVIRTLFKPRPFEHPRAVTDQYNGIKLIAFPWQSIDTPVVMTSWGHLQRFERFNASRASDFIERNRNRAPEPNAP